ncbi:MAG: DNA adenine methylase [Gallionellaceae bacterium]|nr:DNA adenine methylase [Gallionellaceae bacterium]
MITDTAPIGQGGTFASPLRYPGGKGRLGPWLAKLMRHNRISGGWYVEPYAGGAGAAIYLLTRGYVDHILINDLDPVVHAFWWAVLNDTEKMLGLIAQTPVTMESWRRQKAVHAAPDQHSQIEVGFATFFLNRTNRSGILTGGVIGGKAQTGPYALDARYNQIDLAARVRKVASLKRHISLYREDAIDLIGGLRADLSPRSLIYLDPPYYHKGSQLYRNHYKPADHAKIATAITQIGTPWLVTYDNCPEIQELYAGCQGETFSLQYSTAKTRPMASEAMYYGNLTLHKAPSLTKRG